MDLFEKWLNETNSKWIKIALTDNSYKQIYRKEKREELSNNKVNSDLATYGDAILKVCLMKILIERNEEKLTEQKKIYESDRSLVKYIAPKYDLINKIYMDKEKKTHSYNYDSYYNSTKTKNRCKYIATCVEALIAAIFIEENCELDPIINLVEQWMTLCEKH